MAKFQGFNAGNAGQVCLWRASPLGRKGHTQRLGAKALGHPLCTVAAALGRVHHKLCAAGDEVLLPGGKALQFHNAALCLCQRTAHLGLGPCDGADTLQLMAQKVLRHSHRLFKTGVFVFFFIPPGVIGGNQVGKLVAAARVVVFIQWLYKAVVKAFGLFFAHKGRAQLAPKQAKGRIFHPALTHRAIFSMMVKRAVSNIEHNAVIALRHRKAPLDADVGVAQAQQRSREHIVRMEAPCVGKAFVRHGECHDMLLLGVILPSSMRRTRLSRGCAACSPAFAWGEIYYTTFHTGCGISCPSGVPGRVPSAG